jgi:hypothetical protein
MPNNQWIHDPQGYSDVQDRLYDAMEAAEQVMPGVWSRPVKEPHVSAKPEHTPGPWEVFPGERFHPGIEGMDGKISVVIYADQDEDYGVHGRTPEEALANAHLIAAAPDLLAACKQAYLLAYQLGSDAGDELADLLTAAMSKAEAP